METFGVVFATLGAGMILFALTFVNLLVGALVNGLVVVVSGPRIDKLVARTRYPSLGGSVTSPSASPILADRSAPSKLIFRLPSPSRRPLIFTWWPPRRRAIIPMIPMV